MLCGQDAVPRLLGTAGLAGAPAGATAATTRLQPDCGGNGSVPASRVLTAKGPLLGVCGEGVGLAAACQQGAIERAGPLVAMEEVAVPEVGGEGSEPAGEGQATAADASTGPVTSDPQIDVSMEWQRGILADIYYPKVKSLFVEVCCRKVLASAGLERQRATLEMAKRDEAEEELKGILIRLLNHGVEQQTIEGWVDAQQHPRGELAAFAELMELARAHRELEKKPGAGSRDNADQKRMDEKEKKEKDMKDKKKETKEKEEKEHNEDEKDRQEKNRSRQVAQPGNAHDEQGFEKFVAEYCGRWAKGEGIPPRVCSFVSCSP